MINYSIFGFTDLNYISAYDRMSILQKRNKKHKLLTGVIYSWKIKMITIN